MNSAAPRFLRPLFRAISSTRQPHHHRSLFVSTPSLSAAFKSRYSIDDVYPGSRAADVATSTDHLYAKTYSGEKRESFSGYIPINALKIKSMRSSGPGGQSVNTSNTKVEVRFSLDEADWIPVWIKKTFVEMQKNRVNKANEFVITSERTRNQMLNQADCLDRIRHYIREAEQAATPKEETPEEAARRVKRAAMMNEKRLLEKRMNSVKKSGRGAV